MTEITIVKALEEEKPVSKEEREVIHQEISEKLDIPYMYFEQFARMEDELLQTDIRGEKPTLPILVLHKILEYPCIIPIAKNYHFNMQDVDQVAKYFGLEIKKFGGKVKPLVRKTHKIHKVPRVIPRDPITVGQHKLTQIAQKNEIWQKAYTVQYQTIKSVPVIYLPDLINKNGITYQTSIGEMLSLCGIAINPTEIIKSYFTSPGNMTLLGRIRSGYYNEEYLYTQLFSILDNLSDGFYMKNLVNHLHILEKGDKIIYVIFKDENHMKKILNILFDVLWYFLNRIQADYTYYYIRSLLRGGEGKEAIKNTEKEKEKDAVFKYLASLISMPVAVGEKWQTKNKNNKSDKNVKKIKDVGIYDDFIKYLTVFLPWVGGAFSSKYSDSLLFDIYSMHLVPEWEKIYYMILSGTSIYKNDIEMALRSRIDAAKKNMQHILKYQKDSVKAYLELVYRWIYINKFGFEYYKKLFPREKISNIESIIYGNGVGILDVVKKEKNFILTEYEREKKFNEMMKNNRAPWVKIARKMRYAIGLEQKKKLYYELEKYLPAGDRIKPRAKIPPTKTNDWIRSANGFPIICPHVRDELYLQFQRKTDKEIHDFILRYAGEIPLHDAYYCKICGEAITYVDNMESLVTFEGDQPIMIYHDSEGDIKEYIWKYVSQTVRSYIEFAHIKSDHYTNQFISGITGGLHDFIVLIDKKIRKVKTNTVDEIDNKRKLYTIIYTWALLLKIVLENPAKIHFNFQRGFKKSNTQQLFDKVFELILTRQNILIRKIKGINDTFIKESLSKAFLNINSVLARSEVLPPKPIDVIDVILLDPIYWYFVLMWSLSHGKKKIEPKPETVLGFSPRENESWYDKVVIRLPKVSDADIYGEYFVASFIALREYIKTKVYQSPIYVIAVIRSVSKNSGEPIYEFNVRQGEAFTKYEKEMAPVKKAEIRYLQTQLQRRLIPVSRIKFIYNIQYRYNYYQVNGYPPSLLAALYGREVDKSLDKKLLPDNSPQPILKFHKHKWSIHCYVNYAKYAGFGLANYSIAQIHSFTGVQTTNNEWVKKSENLILVDHICEICHYPNSQTNKIDALADIEREQLISNFFNYYQNRCPQPSTKRDDDFHHFKNDKCTNCGVTKEMLENQDEEYFKKYHSAFSKIQKSTLKSHSKMTTLLKYTDNPMKKLDISVDPSIRNWKYAPNIISEVVLKTYSLISNKYKKNEYYNIWNNLGLVEKYDYDKVLSGVEKPIQQFEKDGIMILTRTNKLDIYIKEMIFDYNILLNYKNTGNLPIEIKTILDGMDSVEVAKISNLPQFYSYWAKRMKLKTELDYLHIRQEIEVANRSQLTNFLLEYLIVNLLEIQNTFNKIKKLNFVIYFILKIIRMEKISSKMKDQKAAAVEAIQKISVEDDPSMQDHNQTRAFDDLTDSVDNFSYNEMDYNGENDDY